MPNRAIVLAAGLGTRMRPYNGHIPKPLVEVGGKSLIDYSLDRLADAGVESAVVNVHHLADALERHLAPRQRPHIVISDERGELLGTGGGIAKALPQLGDAPFFLVNSDTVWLDGVQAELHAAGRSLRSADDGRAAAAGADHRQHRLCRPRRFRHAARRPLAPAARERGGALRLCRRGHPLAGAVCRCAEGRLFAHRPVRPRRRKAACSACASKACGCMSARRRRSRPRKPRSPRCKGIGIGIA